MTDETDNDHDSPPSARMVNVEVTYNNLFVPIEAFVTTEHWDDGRRVQQEHKFDIVDVEGQRTARWVHTIDGEHSHGMTRTDFSAVLVAADAVAELPVVEDVTTLFEEAQRVAERARGGDHVVDE